MARIRQLLITIGTGGALCGCGGAAFKLNVSEDPVTGDRQVSCENNLLTDRAHPDKAPYLDHGIHLNPFGGRRAETGELLDLGFNVAHIDGDDQHAFGSIKRVDFVTDKRDTVALHVNGSPGYFYRYERPDNAKMFWASLAVTMEALDNLDAADESCPKCCEPATRTPILDSYADEDFMIEETAYKEEGTGGMSRGDMETLTRAESVEVTVTGEGKQEIYGPDEIPGSFLRHIREFWAALWKPIQVPAPVEASASSSGNGGKPYRAKAPSFGPFGYPVTP